MSNPHEEQNISYPRCSSCGHWHEQQIYLAMRDFVKRRDYDQAVFLMVEIENKLLSRKEELFRLQEAFTEFKTWYQAGPWTNPPLTKKERFEALERDGFRCRYCGANPRTDHAVELHVDHIIPRAQGGDNSLDNRVTACQTCNLGKGSRLLHQQPGDLISDRSHSHQDSHANANDIS